MAISPQRHRVVIFAIAQFSRLSLSVNISKTVADTANVRINDYNMKSHMGFPLTPRSMTLDDLELYTFEFLENFSGFRKFRTQQQLNE